MAEQRKHKEKKKDNKKKDENFEKDVEMFTTEIAKKISTMSKPTKRKTKKLRFFGMNPIIVAVTLIIGLFIIVGLFTRDFFEPTVSLTELVDGLKNNEYSQIRIKDDGKITARGKEFYVTSDEGFELSHLDNDKVSIYTTRDNSLEVANIEEISDLFEDGDLVDQIRGIFGRKNEQIEEILVLEGFAIAFTKDSDKNYIIKDLTKQEIIDGLRDNGVDINNEGVNIKDVSFYSQSLGTNSIKKRVDDNQIKDVLQFNGITIAKIEESQVESVTVDWTPSIFTFTDILQQEGLNISGEEQNFEIITVSVPAGITLDTVLTVLTIAGFVFLGFIIFRSAQASGMGIMQFGQSKAKMFFGKKTDVSFDDVAGIDEAREELNEVVDFLKNPGKFKKLGARIPKGILMFGPPGTGKTLLARAIAGEAAVPFFHTSGSEFEEMLVGAGASRVRDLFDKAKKASPALIFIDEIDAIARKRGTRIQSGTTEQTLNQILVEMDGFEKNTNVIVIAATNRPDVLDRAILRPGRFDRQVRIEAPDKDGRFEILKIHAKNKPLAENVDLEKVAKRTVGFTGADLENILNEAAIIAAKAEKSEVENIDIEDAVSKVMLGPAKKSRKRTEEELKLVAYHEAGHALVAKMTEGSIPVDKISIVSRGSTGGVTMFLPEKDENIVSMKRLLANIQVSLGGRAAEEVVLGDISTGASNDIEQATRTARSMIQKYGMSKDLGLVQYGQSRDSAYLGYHYGQDQDYSEDTARKIDEEVRGTIQNAYAKALDIIKENRLLLDKIADLLIEKEVVDKEEFEELFKERGV